MPSTRQGAFQKRSITDLQAMSPKEVTRYLAEAAQANLQENMRKHQAEEPQAQGAKPEK